MTIKHLILSMGLLFGHILTVNSYYSGRSIYILNVNDLTLNSWVDITNTALIIEY